MEKEITLAGMSTQPSGHLSPDGQLAICLGLMPRQGELAPVSLPIPQHEMPDGYELLLVHATAAGCRIIAKRRTADADCLYWAWEDPQPLASSFAYIEEYDQVRSVAAQGNLLAIATSEGLKYALWTVAGYAILSVDQRPVLELGLKLAGSLSMPTRYSIPSWMTTASGQNGSGAWTTHASTWQGATDCEAAAKAVFSDFNNAISAQAEAQGYFHSPFFVRYAVRLHDGSHILASPPVLMLPSLLPPMLKASTTTSDDEAVMSIDASAVNFFALRYRVKNILPQQLGPYATAIDVFATECVPTYSNATPQGGIVTYQSMIQGSNIPRGRTDGSTDSASYFAGQWAAETEEYQDRYLSQASAAVSVLNITPNAAMGHQLLMLRDFYLIGSIPLSTVNADGEFHTLPVCSTAPSTVRQLPTLGDCDDLTLRISPSILISNGSGILAAGGEKAIAKPWPLAGAASYIGNCEDPDYMATRITVYSRSVGSEGVATTECTSALSPRLNLAEAFPRFLFHPDPAAYKMEIRQGDDSWTLPLLPHPSLDGAYWMGDLAQGTLPEPTPLPPLYIANTPPAPSANSIYKSLGATPFAFGSIGNVGAGSIIRIASALQAMSPGQFGQYPVYVFCTDGIWALPSADGEKAVMISRDCATAIASANQSVAYACPRGVMLLAGTKPRCISEKLHGAGDPWLLASPEVADLLSAEGINATFRPLKNMLGDCEMQFDETSNTLYVRDVSNSYAYACDLDTEAWGMIAEGIDNCFILTRPLKLADPLGRKRPASVAVLGPLGLKLTKVAVLGSDDLHHWRLLGSARGTAITAMRGTGCRYLAVAACSTLKEGETLSSCAFFM